MGAVGRPCHATRGGSYPPVACPNQALARCSGRCSRSAWLPGDGALNRRTPGLLRPRRDQQSSARTIPRSRERGRLAAIALCFFRVRTLLPWPRNNPLLVERLWVSTRWGEARSAAGILDTLMRRRVDRRDATRPEAGERSCPDQGPIADSSRGFPPNLCGRLPR